MCSQSWQIIANLGRSYCSSYSLPLYCHEINLLGVEEQVHFNVACVQLKSTYCGETQLIEGGLFLVSAIFHEGCMHDPLQQVMS